MTKKQVIWLIIKLIGVYFAYWTIVSFIVLIGSIYAYISLPSPPRFGKAENPAANSQIVSPSFSTNPALNNTATMPKAETETPAEKAKNDALKQLLWDLFLTLIYGGISWYLIRDGRFLLAVLSREDPYDESGKPVESDAFPLSKKKEEVVTTLNLSGGKEEITSLNLSEPIEEIAMKEESAPPVVSPDEPANAPEILTEAPADGQNQIQNSEPENINHQS